MATKAVSSSVKTTNFPFLLLFSRLLCFGVFQAIIAFVLDSWESSEKYWLLTATLTNIVSILLLMILFKREGENYFKIFRFPKKTIKKDVLIFLILALVSIPVAMMPGYLLSSLIWGDPDVPTHMMFGPINKWLVYSLMFAFPVTIAFAELATYFVYIMPRLVKRLNRKWLAVMLPVLFLSVQHCTLPFIPNMDFMLYRSLVFLPFALLIGISIYYRPSLFIYFAILHGLMDFGTAYMFFMQVK
ncbi:hypothetical protein ACE01N_17715 [Saccharicrinis sp. FJH2]|uniref:hypothetical protein n=1 Tax=Saccharicrinis sp. FJH65 TaxID=3344659 RepID=UPI0035F49927